MLRYCQPKLERQYVPYKWCRIASVPSKPIPEAGMDQRMSKASFGR